MVRRITHAQAPAGAIAGCRTLVMHESGTSRVRLRLCRTASLQTLLTGDVHRNLSRFLPLPQFAAQLHALSSMTVQPCCAGHHAQRRAANEEHQEHQRQRRTPLPAQEVMYGYRIGILDREAEKDYEDQQPDDPVQIAHGLSSSARFNERGRSGYRSSRLASTRSRSSLPALKCGTYLAGT